MIAPLLKQYAEKNGLSFIQKDVNNATPEELDGASMLPVIYFWDDRVEFDDAFARVSA